MSKNKGWITRWRARYEARDRAAVHAKRVPYRSESAKGYVGHFKDDRSGSVNIIKNRTGGRNRTERRGS